MKILLINPPLNLYPGELISVVPPLGLAYIAAVLEKEGEEVRILDCLALSWSHPLKIKKRKRVIFRLSPPDKFLEDYLKEFNPQVVGISNLFSPSEKEALRLAAKIKKILPKTLVVVGGANASARYDVFIEDKNIDFVVIGEGEETMKELVKVIKAKGNFRRIKGLVFKDKRGKAVITTVRPLIKNLDNLPFPAWHLLPMEEYFHGQPAGFFFLKKRFGFVVTSRGCPNNCSFCTNELIWRRKWRARSVENVMKEIKALKKNYRIEEVQFIDSNISVDRQRMKSLCRALKKENLPWIPAGGVAASTLNRELIRLMAQSGCYALQFGVEHGDLEMQRRIGKIVPLKTIQELVSVCKELGIWTHGNFIVGLPGETKETAYKSLEYAIKADFDSVSFFTALPLPGSRVYEEVFNQKKITVDNLRFYLSKTKCSDLSLAEVQKIIRTSFKKFFLFRLKKELNPFNFLKRVKKIKSFDHFRFYFRILKRFIQLETLK